MKDEGGKFKGHGTLYMKNICDVLQKQVELWMKENIMFRSE